MQERNKSKRKLKKIGNLVHDGTTMSPKTMNVSEDSKNHWDKPLGLIEFLGRSVMAGLEMAYCIPERKHRFEVIFRDMFGSYRFHSLALPFRSFPRSSRERRETDVTDSSMAD